VDALHSTLIVENDGIVREGLRLLLEKTPFLPQTCALEPDDEWPSDPPSVVIVFGQQKADLSALITKLRERYGDSRIVVLAAEGDYQVLSASMQAGANAVLLMSISAEGLVKALDAVVVENIFVIDSRIWPSGALAAADMASDQDDPSSASSSIRGLSAREVEILKRILEGDSNKHIARRLDIAEATVKAHVKTLLRKIGVSNRTQAAIWAVHRGIGQEDAVVEDGAGPNELPVLAGNNQNAVSASDTVQ
jgi:two-component system, NarL family, nitrate/nitrite response regulator NarL